jgi:hypothetical protein
MRERLANQEKEEKQTDRGLGRESLERRKRFKRMPVCEPGIAYSKN